ncbi:hypothetical protein FHX82_006759 [Amycolatopsis bartoniae]|uniref:Uncharacterized protein n=1 Tax=Amycolatopsis bartoniae TaxID=941986 RepID=A0A8H9M7Y0_9PSEU|nr:hypothetical protein [Amycolatopsis bartoniae]MBB2939673.1 hypothetical protein [Amycolatopsis bartoniae]TVT06205.1 hypothetical protein FNH07_21310 [Amycolatopsis bartoniae]GHF36609.1 hypothetical protein GCM10017566_07140 [Amycolatopsis bartoniae]
MTTDTRDGQDYSWLRAQCEFRMTVPEGYTAREVIPAGGPLYDPQLCWPTEDGLIVSDIGGQREPGWDPDAGHGALYELRHDDTLRTIIAPGEGGAGSFLRPKLAPDHFGKWGGHVFIAGQSKPGRAGAHHQHFLYRLAPGSTQVEVFAKLPHTGTIGDGIPGAMMPGCFGEKGSEHEGYFFAQSMMNCTVYRISADGDVEPFITLGPPTLEQTIMPLLVFYAPPHWGKHAGELIVAGPRGTSYTERAAKRFQLEYFRLTRAGEFDPTPIEGVTYGTNTAIAPESFGRYGGYLFSADEGTTNAMHTTKIQDEALPYDAKILATDLDGNTEVFAEGLQGGSTSFTFVGDKMYIGSLRKSYATGEYHEPDGSIYEVHPER